MLRADRAKSKIIRCSTDLNVLIQSARESGRRLDGVGFRSLKKRLLERQCRGLLEFIEPKWTLDTVVGHEAAKARFRQDAALLSQTARRARTHFLASS
jgi:hypothetical protein